MPKIKKIQLNKKWIYKEKGQIFSSKTIDDEIVSILSNRGIATEKEAKKFLNSKYEDLTDSLQLVDIEKATKLILDTVRNKEKITIYGDYDVDGITATALLFKFFESIGISVDYYIPSRQNEGYGLNNEAIKKIAQNGTKLIITVDCGVTSVEEIDLANKLGLQVIVTDHHAVKIKNNEEILPSANAIINPRRKESEYQQELSGVGVAFYLVRALQRLFPDFKDGQEKWLLDYVALGTICDVVPLLYDNRILVTFGLKVLSKSKRPGIQALAQVSGFDLKHIETYHVGFLLGPRLNAAGRLETAQKALKLLITEDPNEALKLASELNEINLNRQELTEEILAEAREFIGKFDDKQKIFLLANEKWPAGVVGIVASRLVDEYSRPILVMEDQGLEYKGSARTIKSFNIIDALNECSEFLTHFGGHAFAAGFSLKKEHFILLNQKLIEISDQKLKTEDLVGEIFIDKIIEIEKINHELLSNIRQLEPFGQGNSKPIFVLENIEIKDLRFVGNPAIHLKLVVGNERGLISGMLFNFGEKCEFKAGDIVDIALTLEENIWNGRSTIEFRALDIKHKSFS